MFPYNFNAPPANPFSSQTNRVSASAYTTMADPTLPSPPTAASPTTVAAPALAPVPNDVEMADSAPAPSAPEQIPAQMPASEPETTHAPDVQPETQILTAQAQQVKEAPAAPARESASTRNSPHPSGPTQTPVHAMLHGAPTRQYLNQHVTPHLLEAMKHLVTQEPEKPLKFLSEWLDMKSRELEG